MLELSFQQFQQLLAINTDQTSQEDLTGEFYHSTYYTKLNNSVLRGKLISTRIRSGITLANFDYTYQQDTKVHLETYKPQVSLCYLLKGECQALDPREPRQLLSHVARDGYLFATNIMGATEGGYHLYKGGTPIKALYLHFSLDSFMQLLGEQAQQLPEGLQLVLKGKEAHYAEFFKFSPTALDLCEALFANPYSGLSGQFYTEAKVIELLAYQLDQIVAPRQQGTSGVRLTAKEEQLLEKCHTLLLERLQAPPSLIELARQVGLSDYRLKQGFRQKYGLSPFQLIAEQRLLKARQLLLAGGMNVNEVAYSIGYSSIGSFSNSFYEKFGIRPSSLLKG